ncbi:unnamed protein product, partial [Scytosiphon promiscuus]
LKYTKEKKLHIFERLTFADTFEKFLQNKYNTVKRFGLNGEPFYALVSCAV